MKEDLLRRVDLSGSVDELKLLRQEVFSWLDETYAASWIDRKAFQYLAHFHDRLYHRILSLVFQEIDEERKNPADPYPFAFLLLGSGGRGELTPSSDQDHMTLFQHEGELESKVDLFYASFMQRVAVSLVKIGFPLCEGNVLATNRKWRVTRDELFSTIDHWLSHDDWKQVREFIIFYDMRKVFGDPEVEEEIRSYILRKLDEFPSYLMRIFENAKKNAVPLSPLGKVITIKYGSYSGSISIKQGMYLPLIKSIRLFAIGERVQSVSTIERIDALVKKGFWKEEKGSLLKALFLKIFSFRHGLPKRFQIIGGEFLPYSKMNACEQGDIKEMLRSLKSLQKETEGYVREKTGERRFLL